MKTIKRTALFLMGAVVMSNASFADARSLGEIRSTKSLIVGITGNLPPFQFKVGNTLVGFEVDIVRAVANDLGAEVVFREITDYGALQNAILDDKVDVVIASLALTSTRDASFDLTNAYACLQAGLFTFDPNIKVATDLKGKRIGVMKNSVFASYVDKFAFDKTVVSYTSFTDQLNDSLSSKTDASLGWLAVRPYMNKVYKIDLKETPALWSIPVGMLVANKNNGLRLAINTSIAKMQRDGRMNTLDKRYFGNDSIACKGGNR